MYGWLWRRLPGPTLLRIGLLAVGAFAVVAVLFLVVFPWAEPRLPFNHVTVSTSSSPSPGG